VITRAARSRISRFIVSAPVNEPDPATFYGGDAVGYTDYRCGKVTDVASNRKPAPARSVACDVAGDRWLH
jgi:hypothetical protein